MRDRVKFYSPSDLSAGYSLPKATSIIESFSDDHEYDDINDVIELYEIRKFVENKLTLKDWSSEFVDRTKSFNNVVARYFRNISPNLLLDVYNTVIHEYKDSFWAIIDSFKITGLLNDENLTNICLGDKYSLHKILTCSNIVTHHDKALSNILKKHESSAEWLLDHYVAVHDSNYSRLTIPSSLTNTEKEAIVSTYLDRGNEANLNYVQLVVNAKNDKCHFEITPKTRLKAKKLEQKLVDHFFQEHSATQMRISVVMSRENGIKRVEFRNDDGCSFFAKYDARIIDHLSYTDIIYYFQYDFEYISKLGFINLISMHCQESVMERVIGVKANNTYRENTIFRVKDYLAVAQMSAMMAVLKDTGRCIEEAIKLFYEKHLRELYDYPSRKISIPSKDSSCVEKIRAMAPELDAIVKQYNLYSREGEIDPELLALEPPIKITESSSCVQKKYYTINDDSYDIQVIFNLLFGDQSMLGHVEPYKDENYSSFFELLQTHKPIDCSKYEQWQLLRLQPLIDNNIIKIGNDSFLQVVDWSKIIVLYHLWEYGACPYWYCSDKMQASINEMTDKGWIICSGKLLTPEEQNFFSFILNNEKYTNAYAIRNHYVHGDNSSVDDEKIHEIFYSRLLIMFILLLLKIDDDLSIKTSLEVHQ